MTRDLGRFFKRVATGYDERELPYRTNAVVAERVGELACRPRSLLDLGTGTGLTIEAVLKRVTLDRVVGVDIAESLLRQLQQKRQNPSFSLTTVHNTIERYMASATETFDLVTFVSGLPYGTEPGWLCKAAAGVLNTLFLPTTPSRRVRTALPCDIIQSAATQYVPTPTRRTK